MANSETHLKEVVRKHNRMVTLFFLLVFSMIQLCLLYMSKSILMKVEEILAFELIVMVFIVFGLYVARLRVDTIKIQDRSIQDLADSHREIAELSNSIEVMLRFNALFKSDLGSDLYFDRLLRELVHVIPSAEFAYLVLENGDSCLKVKAQTGYLSHSAKAYSSDMKESLFFRYCGRDFHKSVIIDHQVLNDERPEIATLQNSLGKPILSLISCPIHVDGKLMGLINVEASIKEAFTSSDRELMDFVGNQAAKIVSTSRWIEQGIYHSKYDVLTGLYNRWQLEEFERSTLPRCIRYKESFLFVTMTLNRLEEINDLYDYQIGDLYLMTFSKLLKNYSRETDLVFRMGGDQFVGIFFTSDVFTFNGKLEAVEQALAVDMKGVTAVEVPCSFAYGIVAFPEEGQGITELHALADQRMKEKANEMNSDPRYSSSRHD